MTIKAIAFSRARHFLGDRKIGIVGRNAQREERQTVPAAYIMAAPG
jgi:hypothetical protein